MTANWMRKILPFSTAGGRAVVVLFAAALCFACAGCGGGSSAAAKPAAPDTIAFVSGRALDGSDANLAVNNIWAMNNDGSNPTPLTKLTAAVGSSTPAWSPDGSKVAYSSSRALDGSDAANTNSTANIWVANADGSNPTPLTKLTAANAFSDSPAWSPDGSKIAFRSADALNGSDNANTTSNIWVINADGSNLKHLTNVTAVNAVISAVSSHPVWSPDGSKLAFVSSAAPNGNDAANTNNTANIWVVNADGSNSPLPRTSLTAAGAVCENPAWSLDGSKIAFDSGRALTGSDAANANSTTNIWVMNADGSNPSPLTKQTAATAGSTKPAWSPDGSKLLFLSLRALDGSDATDTNATTNIWAMNADGSSAAPVTKLTGGEVDLNVSWSPGGGKILFDSNRSPNGSDSVVPPFNIWLVNADGSNVLPLTKLTSAECEEPVQP